MYKLNSTFFKLTGMLLLQAIVFLIVWMYFTNSTHFRCACKKFQHTFPLAKASAALISVNTFFLVAGLCKTFHMYKYIQLSFKSLHYLSAAGIFIWSVVHTVAHVFNFNKLRYAPYFSWGVGFTGFILWITLSVIIFVAAPRIRKSLFHKFYMFHFLAFHSYMLFTFIHQSFCFIKTDKNTCPIPSSWAVISLPYILYLYETVSKYLSKYTSITKVVKHTSVIELRVKVSREYAGKTVWLCCPQISWFEWHPFAVSSFSSESQDCSIHIKIRGNWTRKFVKLLGVEHDTVFPVILPNILVQGPYHNHPPSLTQSARKEPCMFVAAGIGITTFIDLFGNLSSYDCSKILVILILKKPQDVDWALPTLYRLTHAGAGVQMYFTDTTITQINNFDFAYSIGRPDFDSILSSEYITTLYKNTTKTNVYFSGKTSIYKTLKHICTKHHHFKLHQKC